MGEARRRGDFETRKAESIAARLEEKARLEEAANLPEAELTQAQRKQKLYAQQMLAALAGMGYWPEGLRK